MISSDEKIDIDLESVERYIEERDLERYEAMQKYADYNRFIAFLRDFYRNPKQYDRIVIRTDFVDAKRGYCTRKMFDGSEAIMEHCNEIRELMNLLLIRYDISDCLEGKYMTAIYFNDDSDVDHKKIISVFCFKN